MYKKSARSNLVTLGQYLQSELTFQNYCCRIFAHFAKKNTNLQLNRSGVQNETATISKNQQMRSEKAHFKR